MGAHPPPGAESRFLTHCLLALAVNDYVGEADHPAAVWRLAFPPEVRVFGWWGSRRPDPAEPADPAAELIQMPCVAWSSPRGWAVCPVRRLTGGPGWETAGWGERVHMAAVAVTRVLGPCPTLPELIGEVVAAGSVRRGSWSSGRLVGPAVWGLLRLLPAGERLDAELATTSAYPTLPTELRGLEDGGVWEALAGGAEREIVDGLP